MKLSDIPVAWGIAVSCVLVGLIVLLTWLRRKNNESSSSSDAWELEQTRRRRKEIAYGAASYVLLFVCAAVAAALSFHGLVGFGRQNLGLDGGWEYLVPFGLDGAAMFCSVLAVREASHGDAAFGSRFLVWVFAAASAWFNWVHAPRGDVHSGAPQFFAAMSISAALLFDRALKQTRKAALRDQGLVARPLPQIRAARWLRAPRETYGAWSLMLLEGVRSLDEAVELVREGRKARTEARTQERIATRQERLERRALMRGVGPRGGRRELLSITSGKENAAEPPAAEPTVAAAPELRPVETPSRRVSMERDEPFLSSSYYRGERESSYTPRTSWDDFGDPPSSSTTSTSGTTKSTGSEKLVDLTADDDTAQMPKLTSLEERLAELERSFG